MEHGGGKTVRVRRWLGAPKQDGVRVANSGTIREIPQNFVETGASGERQDPMARWASVVTVEGTARETDRQIIRSL